MPDAEFHGEKETFWLVAHVEVHAEVRREAVSYMFWRTWAADNASSLAAAARTVERRGKADVG